MNKSVMVIKSDGTSQPFDEDKLAQSLKHAGASPDTIGDIIDHISKEIEDKMTTTQIYSHAFELLKDKSQHVAVKYSIRRALFDLGPEGFPFEKFVARIFKAWGYDAVTGQMVLGSCVEHEVDVIAWKDKELAMVEAKFHNEFGIKSDLKVILYVKARYDDIDGVVFDYGGEKRTLTEKWLITNTKFTDKAIHYGECKGIKMIGWNYPEKESLHDLISRFGLHPVTSLSLLTHEQKRNLISQDIITCSDLASKPDTLTSIGVAKDVINKVLEEVKMVASSAK